MMATGTLRLMLGTEREKLLRAAELSVSTGAKPSTAVS
jgi:hypothetical protein